MNNESIAMIKEAIWKKLMPFLAPSLIGGTVGGVMGPEGHTLSNIAKGMAVGAGAKGLHMGGSHLFNKAMKTPWGMAAGKRVSPYIDKLKSYLPGSQQMGLGL